MKKKMLFCSCILLAISYVGFAQSSSRIIGLNSDSVGIVKDIRSTYKPFVVATPVVTHYANYPLTSTEILQRQKQQKLYNRTLNTISNNNRRGIVVNLISFTGLELEKAKVKY